ncbi:MAG: glutathione peroxidase [Actinobacteria bacterium]|jgi:glutathione peroxidase|nr:glutathione peroxidase [Actinomycetota bacterium]
MSNEKSLYDLEFVSNSGETVSMSDFTGRPVLIVNTASKCGFTPQYDGLQSLYEEFSPLGLVVLGFPCDQFAHQEPGSDEDIEEFCRINHGVTFPLSTKIDVNGKNTDPVFEFVKKRTSGVLGSSVKWNFTKFLVAPDGQTVTRYGPRTEPAAIAPDVTALLEETVG